MSNKQALPLDLRYAIYLAHKRRCVYTGDLLCSFSEVTIEHIIREGTPDEYFAQKKKDYGLDDSFNLNSLENLLPVKRLPNEQKGVRYFNSCNERFYLQLARWYKEKVQYELVRIKTYIKRDNLKMIKNIRCSDYQILIKEKYKKGRKESLSEMTSHFWKSTDNVALNGFLPSLYNEKGSCLISFTNSDFMVTLSDEYINDLIKELEVQSLEACLFRGDTYENTKKFIILGGSSFHLDEISYYELLDVLQDYLMMYKQEYAKFEQFVEVGSFKKSETDGYYIIYETTREVWRSLINYSEKYDIDRGHGAEYCFNSNGNTINNFKCYLIPEQVNDSSFSSLLYPDDRVAISWRLPYQTDREKIKTGELWTAKQSYIWLEKVLETIKVTQISTCENEHVNKSRSPSYYINIIKRMWGNEK